MCGSISNEPPRPPGSVPGGPAPGDSITGVGVARRRASNRRRRAIVWEIERKLAEDVARPIIYQGIGAGCWHPHVTNITIMVNSIYNGWRWEDVWMDK